MVRLVGAHGIPERLWFTPMTNALPLSLMSAVIIADAHIVAWCVQAGRPGPPVASPWLAEAVGLRPEHPAELLPSCKRRG
jgi:hypothetical protein